MSNNNTHGTLRDHDELLQTRMIFYWFVKCIVMNCEYWVSQTEELMPKNLLLREDHDTADEIVTLYGNVQ